MDFSPIFWVSAAILIIAYIALEVYHGLTQRAGTVVRMLDDGMPFSGMLGCQMEIELDNGSRVNATASGCVLCQNSIRPGARVFLLKCKNDWIISSSTKIKHCAQEKV